MSDALIVRRTISGGGGLSNTDAVLIVTVPTGASVTATKSGTTLTPTIWVQNSDSTRDAAIFNIPSSTFDSNAWTVTATSGAASKSATVVINSAYEYELALSWTFYLAKNGAKINGYDFSNSVTSIGANNIGSQSWSTALGYAKLNTTGGIVSIVSTTTKINLTNYNTLNAKVNLTTSVTSSSLPEKLRGATLFPLAAAYPRVGSASALAGHIDSYANITSTGLTVMQLDVSALLGEYYINISIGAYSSSNGILQLYELYLS